MGRVLTEKFNETMPAWLRKRLLFTDNRSPRDVGYQSADIHPRQKSNTSPSQGLFKDFVNKNIDLSRAKFISVDPNTLQKKKDPRLSDPYLPIFHIVGDSGGGTVDTVYAKGINDTDKWPGKNYKDELRDRALRSIPLKTLLEYTQDFCYLDLSDPTNFLDQDKQAARKTAFDGVSQRYTTTPYTSYYGNYSKLRSKDTGRYITRYNSEPQIYDAEEVSKKLDKSGYIKDPHKFDKKLKELKAKNYSKVLNDIYSRIKTLQAGMIEAFSDYNFKNLQGNIQSDSFSKFQSLVANYNELLGQVDRIVQRYSNDPERFSNLIQSVFADSYYGESTYKKVMKTLRELENSTSDYINVPVDWEVDEFEESFSRKKKLVLDESIFDTALKEDLANIDGVDDVQPVEGIVMADAQQQSKKRNKRIQKSLDSVENVSNGFTGAKKQPVPKKVEYPKVTLDEGLF